MQKLTGSQFAKFETLSTLAVSEPPRNSLEVCHPGPGDQIWVASEGQATEKGCSCVLTWKS